MPYPTLRCALASALAGVSLALDNGVALKPPMGFNSYMSGVSGEKGLGSIADFFVASGMHKSGYVFVNTDEGWETKNRDPKTGELQWSASAYPSGLPTFIKGLNSKGLKYGIYGAASGVTCGNNPGQTYFEDVDAATYVKWGVEYLKSDNCASYALDPSVRFGAMRDALNRTGAKMVLSIEPFSITPDPEQSIKVSNVWRVATDISGRWDIILKRADISDKWAPLAGPGGWNDPDMINLQNPSTANSGASFTLNENRVYFGLWSLMKSPLLLSANLPKLVPELIAIANNTEVIAINQDDLGVQARKLYVNGNPLPWLVGVGPCDSAPAVAYSRTTRMDPAGTSGRKDSDNRMWAVKPVSVTTAATTAAATNTSYQIVNGATGRCLSVNAASRSTNRTSSADSTFDPVVLLPCDVTSTAQHWRFGKGLHSPSSVVNQQSGRALALANSTLFGSTHGKDAFPASDAAYGHSGLVMATPYDQPGCTSRDCQNYDPSQMWYYSPSERLLRHSTYVASMNHHLDGDGYTLTAKQPTWRHHCLQHSLSTHNMGTDSGDVEVWGGPLSGGAFVAGVLNRGSVAVEVEVKWGMFEGAMDETAQWDIRDLWAKAQIPEADRVPSGFKVKVASHDLALFKLTSRI